MHLQKKVSTQATLSSKHADQGRKYLLLDNFLYVKDAWFGFLL